MEADTKSSAEISDTKATHVTLFVLIPPSPLFAAHWSLFVPDIAQHYDTRSRRFEELSSGRRIHVTGDRRNGFRLEIIRGYDVRKHRGLGLDRKFAIGLLPAYPDGVSYVDLSSTTRSGRMALKDNDEGGGYVDNQPKDQFEEVCVHVDAPGPSLRHVADQVKIVEDGQRVTRQDVKDCQWWAKEVAKLLVAKQILVPLTAQTLKGHEQKHPLEIMEGLPMH